MKRMFFKAGVAALIFAGATGPALAADYAIDASHASAVFSITHLGFSKVHGAIKDVGGTFSFDPAKPEAAAATVLAKTASVDTFNEARDKHLKNADFFDAEKYPEITFKSTVWKKTGDNTYDVQGDFTMHGVTKKIIIPVTHMGSGKGMKGEERAGFATEFTIKRSDYGMDKMVGPVGDDVAIEISFEGVKK